MYYEFEIGNLFLIMGVIAVCKWLEDRLNTIRLTSVMVDTTIATILFGMLVFLHTEVVTFKNYSAGAVSFDWVFLNIQIILYVYLAVTVSSRIGMAFLTGTLILFYWERGFFSDWRAWLTFIFVLVGSLLICRYAEWLLRQFWRIWLATLIVSAAVWYTVATTMVNDTFADWAINFLMFNIQFLIVNAFNIRLRRDYNREMMLANQVSHDELTGLKNFRAFSTELNAFYTAFQEQSQSFVLITMDIDHFKHINDTFGHLVGNDVLQQTARVLTRLIDQEGAPNQAYRTGGEEFSLLMPVKNRDEAWLKDFCQRIQQTIRQQQMIVNQQAVQWTVSIGCDDVIQDDDSYLEVYRRADKDLYHSKENGRNMITIRGESVQVG